MERPGDISRHQTEEVLAHMQEAIDSPPPSIEESVHHAEELGVYTHEEAELYIEAYRRAFHKCHELYDEPQ